VSANESKSESLTNDQVRALTDQVLKRLPAPPLTADEQTRRVRQIKRQEEMLRSIHSEWFPKKDGARADMEAVLA
jgi:hypothetical protein